jgi:hypothetical protein
MVPDLEALLRQMVLARTMPDSNSNAVTFRAVDDDQARAMIDDQEGSMQSDLKVLVDADEKPLWDGKSAIHVRQATATQHAEWKRSRDQAIRDEEIDLDARNDPDEWNVYLMGAPKNKVRRKK